MGVRRTPTSRHFREQLEEPHDGPIDRDVERFGGDTHPCPNCGTEVYDQAEWCHRCGQVLGDPADAAGPKPWIMITIALVIAAFVLGLLLRVF